MNLESICLCLVLAGLGFVCTSCAGDPAAEDKDDWSLRRDAMVAKLRAYGVRDARVLEAMRTVRRHVYIPEAHRSRATAYGDHPCQVGFGQTISQPFIVAYMTERMDFKPGEKVLEIGTGSGYQAAVLAELGMKVYTIEIVPELAEHARGVLKSEGYDGVEVRTGDGYRGWPEHAPFDGVIVTCAPGELPQALVEQLKEGGRMILPLGIGTQRLVILRKEEGGIRQEQDLAVRFVPMVHGAGDKRLHLVVSGRVQGVFYRAAARQEAVRLGLAGWVRNRPDGKVGIMVEGEQDKLDEFLGWCRQGPPGARVTAVEDEWSNATGEFKEFKVTH